MSFETARESAVIIAEIEGRRVVEANDKVLQLDIDSERDLIWCMEMLSLLKENGFSMGKIRRTISKSGHWHVYVNLNGPMPWEHRILLQACLGSDRKRELLNYLYRINGGTGDCLLFEVADAKEEAVKII